MLALQACLTTLRHHGRVLSLGILPSSLVPGDGLELRACLRPKCCILSAGLEAEGRAGLDIVHPVRVDAGGSFLSYELWPRVLRKRDVSATKASSTFYQLQYQGRELFFNLTTNTYLLAPSFVSEIRRHSSLGQVHIRTQAPNCHLLGDVQDPELEGGFAAISACDGLVSSLGCMCGEPGVGVTLTCMVALLNILSLCQLLCSLKETEVTVKTSLL